MNPYRHTPLTETRANGQERPPSGSATPIDESMLHITRLLRELGEHGDGSYTYSAGLTQRIVQLGKPLAQLTVGELLALCREHQARFNRLHGAGADQTPDMERKLAAMKALRLERSIARQRGPVSG